MLPEWTLPYFNENYTGPYLSDGRFQSSVANGKAPPRSKLDALSRDHDSAYALSRSEKDRRKADLVYYRKTRTMGWFPRLAGNIVLYGNDPARLVGFGYSGSSGDSSGDGGGANMGNENGRERADRLRSESQQKSSSEIAVGSMVSENAPVVYYEPDGSFNRVRPEVAQTSFMASVSDEYRGTSQGGGSNVSSALRPRRRRRRLRM